MYALTGWHKKVVTNTITILKSRSNLLPIFEDELMGNFALFFYLHALYISPELCIDNNTQTKLFFLSIVELVLQIIEAVLLKALYPTRFKIEDRYKALKLSI